MFTEFHLPALRIDAVHCSDELALRFVGELTAQHIEPLRRHLHRLIHRHACDVSIDLEQLNFASINGLGLLTWLAAELRQLGRVLILLRPTRHLREVLELTRLDRVLAIADERTATMLQEEPALVAA